MRLDSDLYTIVGVMPPGFRHPGRTLNTDVEVWTRHWLQRSSVSCSTRKVTENHSGRHCALEARTDRCAGASAARCLHIATQPGVSRRLPCCRHVGRAARSGERRPGRPAADGVVHPFRSGGICAAYRVREHRQPSSGALFRTSARNCDSVDDGRESRTPGGPTVDRKHALVVISGVVALVTVLFLKNAIVSLAPADIPRLNEVDVSGRVLFFAFLISILTGVLFGLGAGASSYESEPD